jgi:hypothetical protein
MLPDADRNARERAESPYWKTNVFGTPTQTESRTKLLTRLAGRLAMTLPAMSQKVFNGGRNRPG